MGVFWLSCSYILRRPSDSLCNGSLHNLCPQSIKDNCNFRPPPPSPLNLLNESISCAFSSGGADLLNSGALSPLLYFPSQTDQKAKTSKFSRVAGWGPKSAVTKYMTRKLLRLLEVATPCLLARALICVHNAPANHLRASPALNSLQHAGLSRQARQCHPS